jgi:hypothetical protein
MGSNIFPHTQSADSEPDSDGTDGSGTPTLDSELHPGWSWAQPEHIPTPTYWPAGLALGVTLLLWGLITSVVLAGIGLAVFGIALGGWIGEMRNEHREQ